MPDDDVPYSELTLAWEDSDEDHFELQRAIEYAFEQDPDSAEWLCNQDNDLSIHPTPIQIHELVGKIIEYQSGRWSISDMKRALLIETRGPEPALSTY